MTEQGMKKNMTAAQSTPMPKVKSSSACGMDRHLALVKKQVQDPGEGEPWLFRCGKRAARMADLLVLATNVLKY